MKTLEESIFTSMLTPDRGRFTDATARSLRTSGKFNDIRFDEQFESLTDRLNHFEKQLNDIQSSRLHNSRGTNNSKLHEECLSLKSNMKHLGESTALACRHLTSGLSEIQESTVNIFDWADKLQTFLKSFVERSSALNSSDDLVPIQVPKIRFAKLGNTCTEYER